MDIFCNSYYLTQFAYKYDRVLFSKAKKTIGFMGKIILKNNGVKYKIKIFFFVLLIITATISGCSWLYDSSKEASNESYDAGNKAFYSGNFGEARSYYRQIPQSSPFYPQALWMIQKIPFKKGVAAYEQKKYPIALDELSKVSPHSADYKEAQRYIKLNNYSILLKKYKESNSKDRFYIINDLVNISNELENSKLHIENFGLIEKELKFSTSKKKTKYLINILWGMVELNSEPELNEKALNYLLSDFENFYDKPEVRTIVFQIIGNLKIELM